MSLYGVLEEQVGWYEASLSLQERRSRGHFSTPIILVEHILDACGYHSNTPAADLRSIRVLDPACGSGNFLAAAAQKASRIGRITNKKHCGCRRPSLIAPRSQSTTGKTTT